MALQAQAGFESSSNRYRVIRTECGRSNAFAEQGVSLDAWQSVSLWHACRTAKETLLAPEGPDTHPVTILGRGRRLVGGTVSVELAREAAQTVLMDGFFPICAADDRPGWPASRCARSPPRRPGPPRESLGY